MRLLLLVVVACLSYSFLGAQDFPDCYRQTVHRMVACSMGKVEMDMDIEPGGSGVWSIVAGTGTFEDINDPRTIVSNLGIGDNTFKWTILEGTCKNSTHIVNIMVRATNVVNAGEDQYVCEGTSELTLTGNVVAGYPGTWTLLSGSGEIVDSDSPETQIRNPGVGENIFRWTLPQTLQCPSFSDQVSVFVRPRPEAKILMRDTSYTCANRLVLRAEKPEEDGIWKIASGSAIIDKPDKHETLIEFTERDKPIDVTWTVSTDGCPPSENSTVVFPLSFNAEKIPNVITPNGDQKNDLWKIHNIERIPNQVRLYNRWGEQVMKLSNYKNDWSGEGLPHDSYFFLIDVAACGAELKGWLHIID